MSVSMLMLSRVRGDMSLAAFSVDPIERRELLGG